MAILLHEQTEVLTTVQFYKGPNVTLAQSKNILSALDVMVVENNAGAEMPQNHRLLDMAGYAPLTAATDYADSVFASAAIGSEYKYLAVAAGVVTDCTKYIKRSNAAGTVIDWFAIDTTVVSAVII